MFSECSLLETGYSFTNTISLVSEDIRVFCGVFLVLIFSLCIASVSSKLFILFLLSYVGLFSY